MSLSDNSTSARREGSTGPTMSTVLRFWLPVAISWLLMSTGMPIVNAFVARTAEAKLQLAALGIAWSLTIAVESPGIALLSASVTLARDRMSFSLLRGFTMGLCIFVTLGMLLLSITPLFNLAVSSLIGAPTEIAVLVRPALWAMTLFPVAVLYRRFRQGVMIRYGHTRQVGYGTAIRILTATAVSAIGLAQSKLDGATVGGLAVGIGGVVEAAYIHYASRPAVREVKMTDVSTKDPSLTPRTLFRFYWPLAFTSMVWLWGPTLVNFGLVRSPYPVESLATWPVVRGQVSMLSSFGFSFRDVVIALLDHPMAMKTLRRFTVIVGVGSLTLLVMIAFTPLAPWWQQWIAGLSEELTTFAVPALRFAVLIPVLAAAQSWLRGLLIADKATDAIAHATVINLAVLVTMLLLGAEQGWMPGASVAAIALTAAQLLESAWLWCRARPVQRRIWEQAQVSGLCSHG